MVEAFNMRYAPHLGHRPPEMRPQFLSSVGTRDVRAQAEFAASQGFAGLFYPGAAQLPPSEIARFRAALDEFGLECGELFYSSLDFLLTPFWVQATAEARAGLAEELDRSSAAAVELGVSNLQIIVPGEAGRDPADQWQALKDQLSWAGDRVGKLGLSIAIEPVPARIFPDMAVRTFDELAQVMEEVDHPHVKICFDTALIALMADDLNLAWHRAERFVGPIQINAYPEPEFGTVIDFVGFLSEVVRSGRGDQLLTFEFDCADESAAGERAAIDALHRIDEQLSKGIQSETG